MKGPAQRSDICPTLEPGAPEDAGMAPAQIALARLRADEWIRIGVTPALVVLAARRGTIVVHEAFGRYGPDTDSPKLDVRAMFPLASISKVIAATSILTLVDDGLIGLNRPVQEYLPEFVGDRKEQVMLHHLLTHTSGLVDDDVVAYTERNKGKVAIPAAEANEHPYLHELLWLRWDAPLTYAPGERMSYSGAGGYLLLTEIVRRVSGKNLAQFAHDRIFAPLGMNDTYYDVPAEKRARVIRRPPDVPDQFPDPSVANYPSGSVGGYSTAMDMAAFCQMFLNRGCYGGARVLSPAAVAEMTRDQIRGVPGTFKEDTERNASRGYGWDVKGDKKPRYHGSLDSPAAFTHQGAGGVSIFVDPIYELVIVFFSVSRGVMSPGYYHPEWTMDLFTNMVIASVIDI
ncbi:MAG TPA: serine hydrolase domain-containing protein [Candidatus Binatus sp.]|nr:serine hydrolase domain-containing protein [Candidatus Binatus sp.]